MCASIKTSKIPQQYNRIDISSELYTLQTKSLILKTGLYRRYSPATHLDCVSPIPDPPALLLTNMGYSCEINVIIIAACAPTLNPLFLSLRARKKDKNRCRHERPRQYQSPLRQSEPQKKLQWYYTHASSNSTFGEEAYFQHESKFPLAGDAGPIAITCPTCGITRPWSVAKDS